MALMKTSNPALGENTFRNLAGGGYRGAIDATARMTLSGTVNKTGLLLICAFASASWTWYRFIATQDMAAVSPLMMLGLIGGFICAMVTVFKKEWAPVTAPLYALLEGLALGGLSAVFELRYPGIAIQAVGLTFGTLFVLLLAYSSRLIPVTQKFRLGIVAATGGIMVFYLLEMVLGFFGVHFLASTARAHSVSASASSWSPSPPSTWSSTSTSSSAASTTAPPSTWSGTAPSASWSRWSGSTWKSSAC